MRPEKHALVTSLPIQAEEMTMRPWRGEDIDIFAAWPPYPPPWESFSEVFQFRFARMDAAEREAFFEEREHRADRITFVADHADQPAIAYLALVEIDWDAGAVGNMAYRIEPTWCGKGVGTRVLSAVTHWCFGHGLNTLRLDVSAANARAIRCYEKAGFARVGELWRDDDGLMRIRLDSPGYDFLRPHVRLAGPVPQLRFWLMEVRK